MFFISLGLYLIAGGMFWIYYIAIEPFVRRRWPQVLVSWTRLLSGEWRDPIVARDAFMGCAFGALAYCGVYACRFFLMPSLAGAGRFDPSPYSFNLATVLGANFFISAVLGRIMYGIFISLSVISLLFLLRILLRNQKAAIAASIIVMALVDGGGSFWAIIPGLIFFYPIVFFLLMRFGLVAVAFFVTFGHLFIRFPITLDASAWYSGVGYAALAILAVIVLYAFRTSLGGRPLLSAPRLDD